MQRPIRRLPGASDLVRGELRERGALQDLLNEAIAGWGYEPIEPPVLEEADLFLRKSGGELASRLYTVDDPGGWRAALRPEYTASVIRTVVTQGHPGLSGLPARWRYAGPVFRHHPMDSGERRQTTQVGAELVGARGPLADAEVLAIAAGGLQSAGLSHAALTLGHLGVLGDLLLEFELSDRAELFLLSRLTDLRDPRHGPEALLRDARRLRLVPDEAANGDLAPILSGLGPDEMRAVVHQLVASLRPAWTGSRDVNEVEARLLEKLRAADDPERLGRAVRFLTELVQVRGEARTVLRESEAVARRYGLAAQPLAPLAELVQLVSDLPEMKGLRLSLDLGLAPGLAYYTGMVFELTHPGLPGRALGGGGRYDGLVKALGGPDLPALGFAYSLEAVAEARAIERLPALASELAPLTVVVAQSAKDVGPALAEARRLRETDTRVALYPQVGDIEGARRFAGERGAQSLVIVGPNGPSVERLRVNHGNPPYNHVP